MAMAASALLSTPAYAVVLLLLAAKWPETAAFQIPTAQSGQRCPAPSSIRMGNDDMFGTRVDGPEGEDSVLYSEEDSGDESWGAPSDSDDEWKRPKAMSRWGSLNPTIKARIVKEAQDRAIRNKKRREPAADKKRRLYSQYREMQQQTRRDKFVKRALPGGSKDRVKLADISPGETLTGKVISLTKFGAYVDVGSEVDGLLHVSQITRDEFVDHVRNFLAPGDEVEVRVVRRDPDLKKLQLTMLPDEVLDEENILNMYDQSDVEDDRIQLDEVEVDDELWGEIRRVTDYGAYVELGAVVRGFLHFMDHPMFGEVKGSHPKEFMRVGDRVRVWVLDVDGQQKRVKLTANRPTGLPGPRREIQWI